MTGPGVEVFSLSTGWEMACAPAGTPSGMAAIDRLDWIPAIVPGTAAAALRAAGRWDAGDELDFDQFDWWFRVDFEVAPGLSPSERLVLVLEGIATVARVYLNGEPLLDSESMFQRHAVDITEAARPHNELLIHCAALAPLLARPRRPRARWRTQLVSERNLRFYRTMLVGRAPGFAPSPAAVGPWRPVRLERRRGIAVTGLRVRSDWARGTGTVSVRATLEPLSGALSVSAGQLTLSGQTGERAGPLEAVASGASIQLTGELSVPDAEPWWPHTHGRPALYRVALGLEVEGEPWVVDGGRVGFRSLSAVGELEADGLALEINGVPLFARGAVWTSPDPVLPDSTAECCRPVLEAAVAAGMNMLRVPGTACYESDAFYELCDELGILIWQDFMLANFDYPEGDAGFMSSIEREGLQLLERVGGRPCLAVLCGGSEVAQQAAMMGLAPGAAGGPLAGELLPGLVAAAEVSVPYVPSTPWGGDLPFRPDRGVANYYGVGAYRRPLEDARRAEVKFAAECLAFSNVPDQAALPDVGGSVVHHPRWKAGVPRDVGSGWDFEDVRDHYLRELFGIDPVALRTIDPERYLELSRQVTGEVMSEVLGEWRRSGSTCGGALVLWLKDLVAGAGWGLLDHRGAPKAAYHHVARALAPVAVWSTDEGLGGIVAHLGNDGNEPLAVTLRVAMYRDFEIRVDEVEADLVLEPRGGRAENVEALLGRFVDASWAYRFGPPAQDLIALTLEQRAPGERRILSQAFRFPAGRPTARQSAEQLGLVATVVAEASGSSRLTVSARRFAYGVRVQVPGFVPDDDAFSVEPGGTREIGLQRVGSAGGATSGQLRALNLTGRVGFEVGGGA